MLDMMPDEIAGGVVGLLGLFALFARWLGPRRWLVTDFVRNEMFAAREDFWDVAASGAIGFDDPNYRRVREAINSNIRFAHAVSLPLILIHMRRQQGQTKPPSSRQAADAIENIEARRAANQALDRTERAAFWLLCLHSPVLWFGVVAIVLIWTGRYNAPRGRYNALRGWLSDAVQAEALTA
jgi:hypothetical protein